MILARIRMQIIKFILWFYRKHEWHEGWLRCWICKLRFEVIIVSPEDLDAGT